MYAGYVELGDPKSPVADEVADTSDELALLDAPPTPVDVAEDVAVDDADVVARLPPQAPQVIATTHAPHHRRQESPNIVACFFAVRERVRTMERWSARPPPCEGHPPKKSRGRVSNSSHRGEPAGVARASKRRSRWSSVRESTMRRILVVIRAEYA